MYFVLKTFNLFHLLVNQRITQTVNVSEAHVSVKKLTSSG